jgi:GT2 family glycosyltransferase
MADLSVIILSYNTRDLLARCLAALYSAAGDLALEVIVVDNGSIDDSVALVRRDFPATTVIANEVNAGFAAANNQGIALATAPVVLLLNSDAFVTEQSLRRCMNVLDIRQEAGLVGVRLVNEDGSPQAEYGTFATLWDDMLVSTGLDQLFPRRRPRITAAGPVDWVQGACMFARRAALHDVGGLDPHFFMYSEEVEWCRRFWQHGWEVWYVPDAPIVHIGGASSTALATTRRAHMYRSRLGFRRRCAGPAASAALWLVMIAGLGARVAGRSATEVVTRRSVGRHRASADRQLLRVVLRMDPLARWAAV